MSECATSMLRAALLMFCASPQTAARESCCEWCWAAKPPQSLLLESTTSTKFLQLPTIWPSRRPRRHRRRHRHCRRRHPHHRPNPPPAQTLLAPRGRPSRHRLGKKTAKDYAWCQDTPEEEVELRCEEEFCPTCGQSHSCDILCGLCGSPSPPTAPPPSPPSLATAESPPPSPPAAALISKDPHLQLARGGRADFRGLHGRLYNFFSAPARACQSTSRQKTPKTNKDASLNVDGIGAEREQLGLGNGLSLDR